MTLSLLTAGVVLFHLLGIFAAMHAVMHTRTPQGAIGWALGLLLLPYLTLLPYLYLGESRFRGYLSKHQARLLSSVPVLADEDAVAPGCARFDAIAAMQGRPFRSGHRLRLLIYGDATFDVMLAAM